MVDAQEWLESQEEYNTKEKRAEIRKLDIRKQGLEGHLNLREFLNLRELVCNNNYLTNLDLSKNIKLTHLSFMANELVEIDISSNRELIGLACCNNQLTKLNLSKCEKLEALLINNFVTEREFYNQLSDISFLNQLPNPEKLKILSLSLNSIRSDLTPFSRFVNLEELNLGGERDQEEKKNKQNKFYGSLEPLKNLTKLKELDISYTEIDSGLECLPYSVQVIKCLTAENAERRTANLPTNWSKRPK